MLHSSMFSFSGNAPLNLAGLFNYYNAFGFFPIVIDKSGQVLIKIRKTSQVLFIIGTALSIAWNLVRLYNYRDLWKTSNPASLLGTVLGLLWTFSCLSYCHIIFMKPNKVQEFFDAMKETSLLFSHYHSQSRSDSCVLIGILTVLGILPLIIIIFEIISKLFLGPMALDHDYFKCLSSFMEYYKLSKAGLCLQWLWIIILQPLSTLLLYTIESLPLILTYCFLDISKGITDVLDAYAKLKEISRLQNELFGRLIWTNIASSVLYSAQTVTTLTVAENELDTVKTLTIAYVLLMTLLALCIGAQIIDKVQSMKDWLEEESVLENLSHNKLTLLLNDLSTNAVGIKGGSYFTMTHQFLLNVIGSIITYFIVIYQFKPKEHYQN